MLKHARTSLGAVAIFLLAAVSAHAAVPAVLQQVPDDSSVVVVVNDLKGLSTKISNAATRMNVPIPPDLLGMVSQKVGLTKGLDQNGSLALFLELPKDADTGADKPNPASELFVMLVPTSDPKVMLAELKLGEPDKDGISEATLPSAGEESGYVITVGKFVALAQDKAALRRFVTHKGSLDKALTPELAKTFEANDVVVYANVPQFADKAIKQLEDAKTGFVAMASLGAGGDEKTVDTLKTVMDLYFSGIKQVLQDTSVGAVTLRLNDSGATLGFAGHFKADSKLGQLVAAQKPMANVNLDGLPAGTILAAGMATWDQRSVTDLLGGMMDAIYASPAVAKQANAADLKKAGELQKQMLALQSGVKLALYEPADPSKGWIKAVQLSDVSDPVKYQELFQQVAAANLGGANAMNPDLKVSVTATPKALTVKSVALNKYIIKMSFDENADKAEQLKMQQKVLETIYGPDGIVIYSGVVGDKQVLTVIGGDQKFAEDAVNAALSKSTALSTAPEVVAGVKNTVVSPSMVALLPLERWIKLAQRQFMGGAAPTQPAAEGLAIGPVSAPVTMSVGFSQTSGTVEFHVPMSTMISVAETIKGLEGAPAGAMPPAPLGQ